MEDAEGNFDPNDPMINENEIAKIEKSAKKEAKQKGITDRDDVKMFILQKENEFLKDHLKNINIMITQYISMTQEKPKPIAKPTKSKTDVSKNKRKKMVEILIRKIETAKRQLKHLSIEYNQVDTLLTKHEDPNYL